MAMALNNMIRHNYFKAVSSISSLVSCSVGLNSQVLDHHNGSFGLQRCYETFGLNEEENISSSHGNSSNNIPPLLSEVTTRKRASNWSRPKECEAKAKKSSPASCPLLKVRNEKLGDWIQTLQRLVAPFGKTSTVCVLSEAIGYIHFLHEQIQTLSIPYMKSAQSKPPRMVQLDSRNLDSREFKPDLRSRGLCLVPVSYASFINHCA